MADKTEAPTPKRKAEARQKGQGIGRSWEFSMGLTLGVSVLALSSLLPGMAHTLSRSMQESIVGMSPRTGGAELTGKVGEALQTWVTLILPLALLVLAAGVAGNLVSGGLVFSTRAVRFDLSRLNPITGLRNLANKQAFVRLGLSSAKLAILAVISWNVFGSRVPSIMATQGSSIGTIAKSCLDATFELGLTITILLAVVALIDFVVQRRRAMESIKMTKEEVKQEYKEQEGDPQVRGARRRRARQLAFARMMDAIPTADVVVTNPTTLAVALKYDSLTMKAPRIVAKGQRLMAERIKAIAREHKVPIVEDKPLARALFPRPLGSEVPTHLYRAVARLLVLVHQTRFGLGARTASRNRAWPAEMAAAAAGAGAGFGSGRPWWMEAATSIGLEIPDEEEAARYGRIEGVGPAGQDPALRGTDGDYGDGDGRETIPLDQEALERALDDELSAIADEDLADLTDDELAELEAGLEAGAGPAETDDSDRMNGFDGRERRAEA